MRWNMICTRYNFTEDGYRQRFREAKPANHESPSQFVVRLRNFFNKWVKLSNSEATYEGVVSLMILEQFINSCPKELSIHLKKRKLKTVEEMAEGDEQYLFTHGRSFSWGDSRQKREAARSETKRTSGQSDHVRCYDVSVYVVIIETNSVTVGMTKNFELTQKQQKEKKNWKNTVTEVQEI